jgi:uncharacterized membrane protein (UPF0127 family)
MKKYFNLVVLVLVSICLGVFLYYFGQRMNPDLVVPQPVQSRKLPVSKADIMVGPALILGETRLKLEISDTETLQEQGLSNRASLDKDSGMLFVFETPGPYSFWMKDMKFPIDMIFIDSNYKIVTIAKDAKPSSYPTTFTPQSPVKYVLEVNSGFSDEHHLKEGTALAFTGLNR